MRSFGEKERRKMKKVGVLATLGVLVFLLLSACAPKTPVAPAPQETVPAPKAGAAAPERGAPAKEAWEVEWDRVVEAGKKEGTVVVYSTAGGVVRAALVGSFREKYGIKTEIMSGKGADIAEKLTSERRAGLYLADVYVGGATTLITQVKPPGALDPLEPALVLPEVIDLQLWWGGQIPWVDKQRLILTSAAYPLLTMGINTQMVKPGEIKSYRDLLNPKWKGKILLNDPTLAGVGSKWFSVVSKIIMNLDYMRELAKQEPVIIRDQRLQVEWLAKGKYPIAIVPKTEIFSEFQNAGAPIKGINPEEGTWLATGSSTIALVNKAPHPKAAKVFINWFLTKEGQTIFCQALNVQSARLDVPTTFLDPSSIREPGVKYFNASTEEFLLEEPETFKLAKEIFGAFLK